MKIPDPVSSRPAGLQTSVRRRQLTSAGVFLPLFNYFTLMYTFHGSKDDDLAGTGVAKDSRMGRDTVSPGRGAVACPFSEARRLERRNGTANAQTARGFCFLYAYTLWSVDAFRAPSRSITHTGLPDDAL